MSSAAMIALAAAVGLLLVIACLALALTLAGARRARRELADARAEVAALTARLDELTDAVAGRDRAAARDRALPVPVVPEPGYLITTAGLDGAGFDGSVVPDRAVLSVTVGEPLVKLAAFAYGVRRALSPEVRNRIAFEMRREIKRARKERRRAAKQAARAAASAARAEEAA